MTQMKTTEVQRNNNLIEQNLKGPITFFAKTKVSNFHKAFCIQQQIIQLQISVQGGNMKINQ